MTREEELLQARNNYGLNVRKGYPRVMDETDKFICNAFEAGAKWADEHPSQELKQKFIDKACNWLLEAFNDYSSGRTLTIYGMQSMIKGFRATMEE